MTKWSNPDGASVGSCRLEKRGFSLVEVVLAIGVASFCIITLSALIPVGLNANRASSEQITALNLCRDIESDLKSTPSTSTSSPLYQIALPTTGTSTVTIYDNYIAAVRGTNNSDPLPTFSATQSVSSQYCLTITLTAPPVNSPNDPVLANIVVTWPPSARITPVGKLTLNVTINRIGS